jgi:hypothetical protein
MAHLVAYIWRTPSGVLPRHRGQTSALARPAVSPWIHLCFSSGWRAPGGSVPATSVASTRSMMLVGGSGHEPGGAQFFFLNVFLFEASPPQLVGKKVKRVCPRRAPPTAVRLHDGGDLLRRAVWLPASRSRLRLEGRRQHIPLRLPCRKHRFFGFSEALRSSRSRYRPAPPPRRPSPQPRKRRGCRP